MNSPTDLGKLKTNQWEDLRQKAEQLEEAWQAGGPVDLNRFLPAPGHPLRALTLVELVKTDLEVRWQRRQPVGLDHYLATFPELGGVAHVPAALVYEEYRVRHQYGDKPTLASYQARYPRQFPELQILLRSQPLPVDAKAPTMTQATPPPPTPSRPRSSAGEPPAQAETLVNDGPVEIGGGYHLVRRIGTGGFGEVWRAEAPGGIEVAIKVLFRSLDHEEAQRELQSLQLIKQLRHPFLLQTQAYWPQGNRLYIVMELADCSLRDRLKECRQQGQAGIPGDELVRYFSQAAQALDYLHKQGLQHRDIKPDNILLLNGYAKVADFGLARLMTTQRSMAVSGSGTPAYMAPEMWGNKVSHYTDQYCLAVTYAELRLGRRLFPGRDLMELMMQHVSVAPNLDGLPRPEQEALLKALAKQPTERYETCQQFVAALEAGVGQKPTPGQPGPAPLTPAGPGPATGAASPRLSGRLRTGGYDLFHPIASASRGESWRASGPDGKPVALTLIRNLPFPEARAELKGFELIKALAHPHLNKVHACWLLDANGSLLTAEELGQLDSSHRVTLFLASDLIPSNLAQRLDQCLEQTGQPVPPGELLHSLRQAASALDYLNSKTHPQEGKKFAVRHCAVNPDNLLVEGDQIKLGDFSLAKVVDALAAPFGTDMSTLPPNYAAPELFENQVTATSDQYSLALTYYQLRTGTLPFSKSGGALKIIQQHLEGKFVLDQLPEPEQKVIARALARTPTDRFSSCGQLVTALERACQESGLLPGQAPAGTNGSASPPGSLPPLPGESSLISREGQLPSFFPTAGEDVWGKAVEEIMESTVGSAALAPPPGIAPTLAPPVPSFPPAQTPPTPSVRPPAAPAQQAADFATLSPVQLESGRSPGPAVAPAKPKEAVPPAPPAWRPQPAAKAPLPQSQTVPVSPPVPSHRPSPPVEDQGTLAGILLPAAAPPLAPQKADYVPEVPSTEVESYATPRPGGQPLAPPAVPGKTEPETPPHGWGGPTPLELPVTPVRPPTAEVGKRWGGRWLVACLLLALAAGGGVGAWVFINSREPGSRGEQGNGGEVFDIEKARAEVQEHIDRKEFKEAYEVVKNLNPKNDPELVGDVKHLDGMVTKAWLERAQKLYDDKKYEEAGKELDKYVACYPPDKKVQDLQALVQNQLNKPRDLALQAEEAMKGKDWKEALRLAGQLEKEYPAHKEESRQLREKALGVLVGLIRSKAEGAGKEANWEQACKQFEEAYQLAEQLYKNDPKRGKDQREDVWSKWLSYGRGKLRTYAAEIADHMDKVRPGDPGVRKLREDAKAILAIKGPSDSVEKFGKALAGKNLAEARKALGELDKQLPPLSDSQKKLIRQMLAAKVKEGLTKLARGPEISSRNLLDLVKDLEKFHLEEGQFDCHLALAIAYLREHQYRACLASLKGAAGTTDRQVQELDEVFINLIRDVATDKVSPEDRKAVLAGVKEHMPEADGNERQQLEEGYCRLVAVLVRQSLPGLAREIQFADLLPYCREAVALGTKDETTIACLAECWLRSTNSRSVQAVSEDDKRKARKAAWSVAAPAQASPYLCFVRGLVLQSDLKWSQAVDQYQKAFPDDGKAGEPWQNASRRSLAAIAYCKRVEYFPEGPSPDFAFLRKARSLDRNLPRPSKKRLVELALKTKNYQEGREVADELLDSQGNEDRGAYQEGYEVLRLKAEICRSMGDEDAALSSYEKLIDWRQGNKPYIKDLSPPAFYETVLEPALGLADKLYQKELSPSMRIRAAKVYGAKGRLLLNAPYEKWPFLKPSQKSAFRESAAASAKAIELYPDKDGPVMADYYADHGFALAALTPVDMGAIQKDWERALEIDGKHLWGLALKANYNYYQATFSPPGSQELIKKAEEAIRTYDKAIKLAAAKEKKEKFLTFCHASNGNIYVLMANNRYKEDKNGQLVKDYSQIGKDLRRAEEEALLATQLSPDNERAWGVLGNAREDLAWSALGKNKDYYPEAIKAFENQKKYLPIDPQGNVNEARTYIKWAEDVPALKNTNLTKAQRELSEALKRDPGHAEGNYWQGKLYLLQGQKSKAFQAYSKALTHPTRGWEWLYPIKADLKKLESNEKDLQDIFAILLRGKKRADYGAQDAAILWLRYLVFSERTAFVNEDLKSPHSQLIADASDVGRLAKDPKWKALGYSAAANARLVVFKRTGNKAYRDQAVEDMLLIFKYDPQIPGRGGYAGNLAVYLGNQAGEAKGQVKKQIKLYQEAIHYAQIAFDEADQGDKPKWRQYESNLNDKLKNLGQA